MLFAFCAPRVVAQDFVEGPRLQLHSPTHATLTFELNRAALAYVHVANNANFNNARIVQPAYTSDDGRAYSFELSGLSPESNYFLDVQLNGRSKKTLPFKTVSYQQHYAQAKASTSKTISFETEAFETEDSHEYSPQISAESAQANADLQEDGTMLSDEAATALASNARVTESENPHSAEDTGESPDVEEVTLNDELELTMDNELEDIELEEGSDAALETAREKVAEKATPDATDTADDNGEEDEGERSEPAFVLKPNASDKVVENLPEFKPPINAKAYGLVIQPTLGHSLIKIYMSERDKLSPQSEVVIFDHHGVDRKRTAQVLRENGIQGIDLRSFERGKYYLRLEALDGTAIWGAFQLR